METKKYTVLMTQEEIDAIYTVCERVGGADEFTARDIVAGRGRGIVSDLRQFVSKNRIDHRKIVGNLQFSYSVDMKQRYRMLEGENDE